MPIQCDALTFPCRLCRDIPANRDEVFSLHTDAPNRRLFRCQTHSHCCLDAARLHPAAAAPWPRRDPCPGQDLSLRWALCPTSSRRPLLEPRTLLLLLLQDDRATGVKTDKVKYFTSGCYLQNKVLCRIIFLYQALLPV